MPRPELTVNPLQELSEYAAARTERTLQAVFAEAASRTHAVLAEAERRRCDVCKRGMVGGQPAWWRAHGICRPEQMEPSNTPAADSPRKRSSPKR